MKENPVNAGVETGTLLCGLEMTVFSCDALEVEGLSFFGNSVEVAKGGCLLGVMLTVRGVLYPETGGPGILTLLWLKPTERCGDGAGLGLGVRLACMEGEKDLISQV